MRLQLRDRLARDVDRIATEGNLLADAVARDKDVAVRGERPEVTAALRMLVGSANGRNVVVSPQSGVIVVRALPDQLRAVGDYLKATRLAVERQVILEAKILEVQLNSGFQSGVNWSAFRTGGNSRGSAGIIASSAPDPPLRRREWIRRAESGEPLTDRSSRPHSTKAITPEQRDAAVNDLIALVGAVDGILQAQASADADYFTAASGTFFTPQQLGQIHDKVLKAYRWQYIVSGVMEPRFQKVLFGLLDETQATRVKNALAPLSYAVPDQPDVPMPLAA